MSDEAPDFVQRVTAVMMADKGDLLPVSAFPVDGTWPTGTTQWEKRNIALEIPVWDAAICIQCNKCAMVCPHAAIRAKVYEPAEPGKAPRHLQERRLQGPGVQGHEVHHPGRPRGLHRLQLCVQVCPAKDKSNPKHKAINMAAQAPLREAEAANYKFFLDLPEPDRTKLKLDVKGSQFLRAALRVLRRLRRLRRDALRQAAHPALRRPPLIANATGCSSIYGGNLPTTPYSVNKRRPRPGLGQLAVRGQRRVRPGHAPRGRQADQEFALELLHQPGRQARR